MQDNPNINDQALGGEPQLSPAPATASVEAKPDTLTLEELNQKLGKNFTDKETAIKALKDTFSFVGKRREDIEREVYSKYEPAIDEVKKTSEELAILRKEIFYKDNPQYAAHRNLIDRLGKSPAEVVNNPDFKQLFEKADGFDKSQNLKTVLETSPRIQATRDSFAKARDLINSQHPAAVAEAENLIVKAVRSQFDF